jgi:hypothetical protein
MWYYVNNAMRYINHFGTHEWMLLLLGALVLGAVCMRGFGSRSNY